MRKIYVTALVLHLFLTQFLLTGSSGNDIVFPFSSWNLFGDVPLRREMSFLYLEDLKTGEWCYFYLCPRVDKEKITPSHAYAMLRDGRTSEIFDYFEGKIDLAAIDYKIRIQKENTTMRDKWKELSRWIKN